MLRLTGVGLVSHFDVLTNSTGRKREVDADRCADRDHDAVAVLGGKVIARGGDAVTADGNGRRAVYAFAIGRELTLAPGLLIVDDDGCATDGGA